MALIVLTSYMPLPAHPAFYLGLILALFTLMAAFLRELYAARAASADRVARLSAEMRRARGAPGAVVAPMTSSGMPPYVWIKPYGATHCSRTYGTRRPSCPAGA